MCVIIYKPENTMIDAATLRAAWKQNDHGAGLAYFAKNGDVQIKKGFFYCDDLIDAIDRLQRVAVVIHFRLATHGKINALQCHPFAIQKRALDSKAGRSARVAACLFHNGIISGYGNGKISDTIDFVSSTLARVPARKRLALLSVMPGKYALLQNGKVFLVGAFKSYRGLECSNLYFLQSQSAGKKSARRVIEFMPDPDSLTCEDQAAQEDQMWDDYQRMIDAGETIDWDSFK